MLLSGSTILPVVGLPLVSLLIPVEASAFAADAATIVTTFLCTVTITLKTLFTVLATTLAHGYAAFSWGT
jgi:hypothetical protein